MYYQQRTQSVTIIAIHKKLQANGRISEDFYRTVDSDYGIDPDAVATTSDNAVIIPRIEVQLTQNGLEQLSQVDVLRESSDIGANI